MLAAVATASPHARLPALLLLACAGWGPPEGPARAPQGDTVDASEAEDEPAEPDERATSEDAEPAHEAAEAGDPFADPPPRDPDDAPFMRPPHNQLGQWSAGRERPLVPSWDDDHHVQLTAVPAYAAFHVPFIGRGAGPFRGGGASLELDVRVFRWLFVRAYASHTVHPVFAEADYDEDDGVTELAEGGLIQATNTGLSLVYALDIGRFVPKVDVGAGLLFVRSPSGPQAGQWGGECRANGVCDLGLSCSAEEICRPTPVFEGHVGVALDVLLGRRWAVGLGVRYYALVSALTELPVYLMASVRLSARF